MSFLPKDPKERKYTLLGLRIAGDFGASIAIPIIIFVIVGQKIDARYGISPWATITGFVIAAIMSGRSIYRKAKQYGRQYDELNKDKESTE